MKLCFCTHSSSFTVKAERRRIKPEIKHRRGFNYWWKRHACEHEWIFCWMCWLTARWVCFWSLCTDARRIGILSKWMHKQTFYELRVRMSQSRHNKLLCGGERSTSVRTKPLELRDTGGTLHKHATVNPPGKLWTQPLNIALKFYLRCN